MCLRGTLGELDALQYSMPLVLLKVLLMVHEYISDYHPSLGHPGDSFGYAAAL